MLVKGGGLMKTFCGIDLGTQSYKVILYDYEKKSIVETAQVPIDMISANDGTREQKAEWYDEALKASFGKLSKTARQTIAALGSPDSSTVLCLWMQKAKPCTT